MCYVYRGSVRGRRSYLKEVLPVSALDKAELVIIYTSTKHCGHSNLKRHWQQATQDRISLGITGCRRSSPYHADKPLPARKAHRVEATRG